MSASPKWPAYFVRCDGDIIAIDALNLCEVDGESSLLTQSLVALVLLGSASRLDAQATPAASRAADLQVGVGYTFAKPGYVPQIAQGFTAYADLDLTLHLGIEADFHQASGVFSQKTYEIGGRYFRTYGRIVPYAKGMVGRGVFDYPNGGASLAYNIFSAGVGLDFKLSNQLHLRGEYEFQKWAGFQNGSIDPHLVTVGVAYHFDGRRKDSY